MAAETEMEVDENLVLDQYAALGSENREENLRNIYNECKSYATEKLVSNFRGFSKVATELTEYISQQEDLVSFIVELDQMASAASKAKSSKLITGVLNHISREDSDLSVGIFVCREVIRISRENNRRFLRHRVEEQLTTNYFRNRDFDNALKTIMPLLYEMKRLDDKILLVRIHLLESRIQHALRNIPKAKAALTASRASAHSVYVDPELQANLDMQGGIIATEENDFKTGYSYFFEAFEGSRVQKNMEKALQSLIYMFLCKVMARKFKDVNSLVSSKSVLEFESHEVEHMHAISKACERRDLNELERAITNFDFGSDTLLENKMKQLSSSLLEENLLKLLEPYSKVQIEHIAKLIDLPVEDVSRRLSHMILDKKLLGILDQGAGTIILYDAEEEDETFTSALDTLETLEEVIDQLMYRAQSL